MTNNITGFIGITIFLAFIGGLAESIAVLPFIVIVVSVGLMALYDFYESIRDARDQEARKAALTDQGF